MFQPSKFYGQNFLINKGIIEKIIVAAELSQDDVVLEVGPGTGVLTEELVKLAGRLIAVEKDPALFEKLKEKFSGVKNLELVNADIFRFMLHVSRFKIVANIPYNVTGKFFQKFLSADNGVEMIVVMVQKEVGDKLLGRGGRTLMTLAAELYGQAEKICDVAPGSFSPPPKIDSMVVRLRRGKTEPAEQKIMRLAKMGFINKRKKLVSNLSTGLKISKTEILSVFSSVGLDQNVRAEKLSKDDWLKLSRTFFDNLA